MSNAGIDEVLIAFIAGSAVIVLMALFSISFIIFHRRRQRDVVREKQVLEEKYQRELLVSQLEIQNQTLLHVAEDLHDNIGQLLTVAVMRLNGLEDEQIPTQAQQSVHQTRDLIRTIITEVRTLSKTLDINTVQRFGLLPSLTLELERIQRTGRFHAQLTTAGDPYPLGEQAEMVLVRMAQESLNNALKHGRPRNLSVSANYEPAGFALAIADDGRGFSVEETMGRPLSGAGAGLGNLHRRAALLGGTCTVTSEPGVGTRVEIRLPRQPTV